MYLTFSNNAAPAINELIWSSLIDFLEGSKLEDIISSLNKRYHDDKQSQTCTITVTEPYDVSFHQFFLSNESFLRGLVKTYSITEAKIARQTDRDIVIWLSPEIKEGDSDVGDTAR